MKKTSKETIVLVVLFTIFLSFILFLTFRIRMGVSSDSYYHLRVSQAYSTTLGIPPNTPDTYQWRDITRIPYLYFWINGRLLNINQGYINEVILLRLVNVIYSFLTVFVIYLLSREVLRKKWERLFPVFLITNTLMFVFLSASINYDNLANLFSVLSIYFFVKFVKSKLSVKFLLLMLVAIGFAGFTKYTTLPLGFILIVLSMVEIFKKKEMIKDIKWGKELLLLIPISVLLFFNIQIYGVNIYRYGSLEPKCEQILTHEQCLENGVYYRDNVTRPAIEINGVSHIVKLILSGERIDPVRYFGYWVENIIGKIFGIMGDSSLYMPSVFKYIYISVFALCIGIGVIHRKKWSKVDKYLMIVIVFYIGVLFFVQNYNMYLKRNHMYLALQGRYIFPVLPAIYILFSKSFSFLKNNWLKYLLISLLIVLFFYSTIPFFLLNVEKWWYDLNF